MQSLSKGFYFIVSIFYRTLFHNILNPNFDLVSVLVSVLASIFTVCFQCQTGMKYKKLQILTENL